MTIGIQFLCTNNICIKKYVKVLPIQAKYSSREKKQEKQPAFSATLIQCICFNRPPHNLACEQSFYNIVNKEDYIVDNSCYRATLF